MLNEFETMVERTVRCNRQLDRTPPLPIIRPAAAAAAAGDTVAAVDVSVSESMTLHSRARHVLLLLSAAGQSVHVALL